jgi:hypothetical protein
VSVAPTLAARRRRMAVCWAIAAVLGSGAVALAQLGWDRLPHPLPLEELAYYPSGELLKPATLGHPEAAADLAWLRAVQYYGEHRQSDNRFERMPHVFDILTSLSPSFLPAYVFGAFAMAQEGGHFPRAEALMMKGMEANPRSGRLAFEMGFLYYVKTGGRDLRHAAECFEQAARQPDAPPEAARFAAFCRQNAGDLRVAYALWENVYRTSANPYLRDIAERNMREIRDAVATNQPETAIKHLSTPRVIVRPSR